MRVLAAPDKFRGTLTAPEVAEAVATGAGRVGAECVRLPMADGGEGTVDAFGGANRSTTVTGPLGEPVEAAWRYDADSGRAVIESAAACGLELAGGADGNDPEAATTRGVGELVAAALAAGARRIIVGVGGSATTDGGAGAVSALREAGVLDQMRAAELLVCCDVRTPFTAAARVFAPQKGADAATVERLSERLARIREFYVADFGFDPEPVTGSGAAGGLAGGLAALGARLLRGADLIADEVGLYAAIDDADLVITGEGRLDATSLQGKVVLTVTHRALAAGRPVVIVAGEAVAGVALDGAEVVSLIDVVGHERAFAEPATAVADVVAEHLRARTGSGRS